MTKPPPQYSIAFNEHSVHAGLKQLKEQVADLPDDLLEAAQEQDQPASLARLEPVLDYVGALLASADTALVTPQMLEALGVPIQQISSALTPLKENRDFEQVPTVQANVEGLLQAAMQIAGAIGVWAKTDQKEAAAHLGEAATAKTRQLQKQASNLQGKLNQLQEQAAQASESVKTTAEEQVNGLKAQLDTLKEEADAERAKVQGAVDEFNQQVNSTLEARNTEFEETRKELTAKAEQAIEESKEAAATSLGKEEERADAAITSLNERSGEIMDFLAEKKQEAIDMVDAAATSSTAGGFKREAEEQKEQADRWRLYAVLGGAAAAVVALAAVVLSLLGENNAGVIITKIAAVTLLLGIAGYAAGQSGQHRRREQRARRLYLELVAFKPFSEPLDDPEKNAVRKEFIERLFVGDPGAEGEDHKGNEVKLSDENLSALLKVIDLIRSTSSSST
jgi:hypothetical protein